MIREIEENFPGIYLLKINGERLLTTRNLTPGTNVYGESIYTFEGVEYRSWNPTRSKLAAAIQKGLKILPIQPSKRVLYLGAASGTTVSHISDIVGSKGHIWAVEFSARSIRDLIEKVSRYRDNVSPILADARTPWEYASMVNEAEVIFADIAQPNQAEIVIKNSEMFLRDNGWSLLTIKSRSIDVSLDPEKVYRKQLNILESGGFELKQVIKLDPFEKDHALALSRYHF